MPAHEALHPDQFFHGSGAELEPGQIIEPRENPNRNEEPMAYASPHMEVAQTYARYSRSGPEDKNAMGHIYEVEPVEGSQLKSAEGGVEVKSNKGFRVLRKHSSHPVLGEGH